MSYPFCLTVLWPVAWNSPELGGSQIPNFWANLTVFEIGSAFTLLW